MRHAIRSWCWIKLDTKFMWRCFQGGGESGGCSTAFRIAPPTGELPASSLFSCTKWTRRGQSQASRWSWWNASTWQFNPKTKVFSTHTLEKSLHPQTLLELHCKTILLLALKQVREMKMYHETLKKNQSEHRKFHWLSRPLVSSCF